MVVEIDNTRDFYRKSFSNLMPKMGFEVEVDKVSKAWVYSNFFVVVHMIDIEH